MNQCYTCGKPTNRIFIDNVVYCSYKCFAGESKSICLMCEVPISNGASFCTSKCRDAYNKKVTK